ncbi:MAG: ExbD/TolR family protein [Wenzhouxiangella sp.]
MIGRHVQADDEETGGQTSYLTSMVDVLFMLLVFLVLTANAAHYQITVDLPESSRAEALEPDAWLIEDRGPGAGWHFQGETFTSLDGLAGSVRERLAREPDPSLTVAVESTSQAQRLIDLLETLNQTGVQDVRIATQGGGQ